MDSRQAFLPDALRVNVAEQAGQYEESINSWLYKSNLSYRPGSRDPAPWMVIIDHQCIVEITVLK